MIKIDIPGGQSLRLTHLVLDVNGTVALDGSLLAGVAERLLVLRDQVTIHLLTADTHGRQREIDAQLGLTATILPPAEPPNSMQQELKAAYVRGLGEQTVVAIGNGLNDARMLDRAALGIAVLGREGLAAQTLAAADVICSDVNDALDLLLQPNRLCATLRP